LLLFISSSSARASVTPRVLAFYYAWYDQNTWTPSLVSDLPAQTYNSNDPAAMARQIQQAQGAGIDAFVVSWIGTSNPTDSNFKTMLSLARSANFEATIDLEVEHFATTGQVVSALSYVRDNLITQPAFLRDNGHPVLFFWREQNFSVGDWANIRAQVDPNHQQIWIAEGVDISYQQVFNGHHLYSIAWSPDVNRTLDDWAGRVRRTGADKLWVATVMPGYDDTRTGRPGRFARARDNGNFYRATWQAAIGSNPDLVIIDSFNEWVEGTMIEPSVSYGNLYLDLTRQFAARFKSGAPAPAAISLPATVTPTAQPTLQPDQRLTTDILRVHEGPGLDYRVLGRLRANQVVQILGRTKDAQWLQIAYPDSGHTGWVSAEFVAPQEGLEEFPVAEVQTPPAADLAETPIPSGTLAPPQSSPQEDDLFYNLLPWY
jgi:hypothetical protein